MTEDERNKRADTAFRAVLAYSQWRGHEGEDTLTEIQAPMIDLLHEADLHQGMGNARDFLDSVLNHFEAERDEAEENA